MVPQTKVRFLSPLFSLLFAGAGVGLVGVFYSLARLAESYSGDFFFFFFFLERGL